jgi:4-aminobutyrate--pyruvate transaminase
MIDDEVICGFGRTGNWFVATTMGMVPTSMSMAKQMTASYVPLSAVAINAEMAEVIERASGELGTFGHGFTYGGHPLGCAVALKTIEIYQRRDIVGRVRSRAPLSPATRRRAPDHPLVGEARGVGLVGALELSPDKARAAAFAQPGKVGPRLAAELVKRGAIYRAIGDVLAACPPMIIAEDEIEALFAPMGEALDATLHWARAEGHMG